MKAIFCITGLAIQGLTISAQAQTGKPNIVVIMTDQQNIRFSVKDKASGAEISGASR